MSLACLLSGPRPAEANTSETEPGDCHALVSKGITQPLILVPSSVYNHHNLALVKKYTQDAILSFPTFFVLPLYSTFPRTQWTDLPPRLKPKLPLLYPTLHLQGKLQKSIINVDSPSNLSVDPT
jgi:hypothetical protein